MGRGGYATHNRRPAPYDSAGYGRCARSVPVMKGRRSYGKSGFHALKARLKRDGLDAVDRRTQLGRAISEKRAALVRHLGGAPSVTQADMIEDYITLSLFVASGAAALQALGHVNARRHVFRDLVSEVRAVIRDRHAIGKDLGWDASVRDVPLPERLRAALASRSTATSTATENVEPGASCEGSGTT